MGGPGEEVQLDVRSGDLQDTGPGLHCLPLSGKTGETGEPVDLVDTVVHSPDVSDALCRATVLLLNGKYVKYLSKEFYF